MCAENAEGRARAFNWGFSFDFERIKITKIRIQTSPREGGQEVFVRREKESRDKGSETLAPRGSPVRSRSFVGDNEETRWRKDSSIKKNICIILSNIRGPEGGREREESIRNWGLRESSLAICISVTVQTADGKKFQLFLYFNWNGMEGWIGPAVLRCASSGSLTASLWWLYNYKSLKILLHHDSGPKTFWLAAHLGIQVRRFFLFIDENIFWNNGALIET